MPRTLLLLTYLTAAACWPSKSIAADAPPSAPKILRASPANEGTIVALPDGSLKLFYVDPSRQVVSLSTADDGRAWSAPRPEFPLPGRAGHGIRVLCDSQGELHVFFIVFRGEGRQIAVDRLLDIWHARSTNQRRNWKPPQPIFEGYCGALCGAVQLDGGRLVFPFAAWIPGRAVAPPTGANVTTTVFSDDRGATWHRAQAALTAPCHAGFNGNNYGAIEPTILQLADGRVWMLMRTQTGFLYQSFSDDGDRWSAAAPSAFHASSSPACLLRLRDGRIVLFWNNCEMPPRHEGQGVYGGRDALHAAISSDEGRTWHGFREIYRDPLRNEDPPKGGDRGTAYPSACQTPDGNILLTTGQGEHRRSVIQLDPDWLLETHHDDDFSAGMENWSVFKSGGPASRYWRARVPAAHLVDADSGSGRILRIADGTDDTGAGAVWNFPAGRQGKLTLKFLLEEGTPEATVALADRFFDPCDDAGQALALYRVNLATQPAPGPLAVTPETWHTLELEWDWSRRTLAVALDGRPVSEQTANINAQSFGPSYLRLHVPGDQRESGLRMAHVEVDVTGDQQSTPESQPRK